MAKKLSRPQSRVPPSRPPASRWPARCSRRSIISDRDGNLQAVPGFTLEEFEELYKVKNQLVQQNAQPRYTVESVSLSGSTDGQAPREAGPT